MAGLSPSSHEGLRFREKLVQVTQLIGDGADSNKAHLTFTPGYAESLATSPETSQQPGTSASLLSPSTTGVGHRWPVFTHFCVLSWWVPDGSKAAGLQAGSSGVTLTAQDDPAILVGSGESREEAFDVHQWGSGPRRPVLPLLRRGCRSCTEQRKEEGLGARTAGGALHLG